MSPLSDAIKFSLPSIRGSNIPKSNPVSYIISTSWSADRAVDTIFAGNKPFNLTNKVIFVPSPGHRTDKKSGTFTERYTGGKNEFLRRKHSTLSHVRIVRRGGKTAGCKCRPIRKWYSAMLLIKMQRNRFADAHRRDVCKAANSMEMTDVNYYRAWEIEMTRLCASVEKYNRTTEMIGCDIIKIRYQSYTLKRDPLTQRRTSETVNDR